MADTMAGGYELPFYPFKHRPEISSGGVTRHPVVVVGAGLAGLTAACDLALRGVPVVVLDDDDTVGVRGASSRGIVYAQKSLEIFDRLGIYERIRDKGVTWSVGKTLAGNDVVYSFDAASASQSRQPPFINIQQFYIEWFLVDRLCELGNADLRWKSRVAGVSERGDCIRLDVETPGGRYQIEADWVLDCEGVQSVIRDGLGIATRPSKRHDRWCISDVRFRKPLPVERWTWVEAPFNENRAVWQHLMADGVWRMDFQMDPKCDLEEVSRPEVAAGRLRAQLGDDIDFDLVWVGPYSYRSFVMDSFRRGRVFFLGDSAHQMSPFGARGGNSGIQDADNLCWKLDLVLAGKAPESLLDSYDIERRQAAVENVTLTRRTNRFLSPDTPEEKVLRDAVISLAREYEFARPMVNTGRLSVATVYRGSPVIESDGTSVQNVPVILPNGREGCLVDLVRGGSRLVGIVFGKGPAGLAALAGGELPVALYSCGGTGLPLIGDPDGRLARSLAASDGDFCLLRPDLHLAAKRRHATPDAARRSICSALGWPQDDPGYRPAVANKR